MIPAHTQLSWYHAAAYNLRDVEAPEVESAIFKVDQRHFTALIDQYVPGERIVVTEHNVHSPVPEALLERLNFGSCHCEEACRLLLSCT